MRDVLAVLDDIASQAVAAARPLELRAARPQELEAVFRLRYDAVIAAGWLGADTLPDGLERDDYDDVAVHVVALDSERVAGTARIVVADRLPLEEAYDLALGRDGRPVELDRVVVSPEYRAAGSPLLFGLLGCGWLEARRRGRTGIAGIVSAPVLGRYESLGLRFDVLGPARTYWGEERFPVLLDLEATAALAV